jgi:hypothetical protein
MTANCRQREECFWSLDHLGGGGFSAKYLVIVVHTCSLLYRKSMATSWGPRRAFSWASKYVPSSRSFNCTSCNYSQHLPRVRRQQYATGSADPKPFYVTTPIFYVNAGMYFLLIVDELEIDHIYFS